jgi:PTH1 family peptidyl-tRNA hydrolase
MKVICGLGNPGAEYEATRHNVGWWVLEHARRAWDLPPFRRERAARVSAGAVAGQEVLLLAPQTYMNRSGRALGPLLVVPEWDFRRDLLVVVDDSALATGRVRFRARGSSGGHNGLRSIEATLRSQDYARLRIGVGAPPPDVDLADWVLAPFSREEEAQVRELAATLPEALRVWLEEGAEAAGNRFNR